MVPPVFLCVGSDCPASAEKYGSVKVINDFKVYKVVNDPKIRRSLQTKTVSGQVLENQQVYIQQKICLRYFKLSQTYFELCALYFQLSAGSFLQCKKNIFFVKVRFGN